MYDFVGVFPQDKLRHRGKRDSGQQQQRCYCKCTENETHQIGFGGEKISIVHFFCYTESEKKYTYLLYKHKTGKRPRAHFPVFVLYTAVKDLYERNIFQHP